jgi:hypothetical protein
VLLPGTIELGLDPLFEQPAKIAPAAMTQIAYRARLEIFIVLLVSFHESTLEIRL